MKYLLIIAVTGFVMMGVVGCGQGAANAPSGSTDLSTSPGRSGERETTAEQMTAEQTTSFYRIPVPEVEYSNGGGRGGGVLECADKRTKGAVYDYALGIGEKASPVEQTRRKFSKRIEEGDKVEIADQVGPTEGWYGEALRTVRVVRDGRVVALMFYKRGQEVEGGWLLDSYESCGEF
jgi:hypothetical protein